jgi:hypothetical protein
LGWNTAVNAEFEVKGGKEYVIIPTTFRPNQEAQFNITLFSRLTDNITLAPLHDSAENLVFVRPHRHVTRRAPGGV